MNHKHDQHTYATATMTVFKESIQKVILNLHLQATSDGYTKEKDIFRYTLSQVNDAWIVILLVFCESQESPKEYIETISIHE